MIEKEHTITLLENKDVRDGNCIPFKGINNSHLCILKNKSGTLAKELFPIESHFEGLLPELKELAKKDDTSIIDLQNFILAKQNGDALFKSFKYCFILSSANDNGLGKFKIWTEEELQNEIDEYNEQYSKKSDNYKSKTSLISFVNDKLDELKDKFVNDIENHIKAYDIQEAYKKCEKDARIKAYSHRDAGFKDFDFKLNTDLHTLFRTNFGYGRSAKFFEILKYKGIKITPYSDWVTYHFAKKEEIIEYTRSYSLSNNEWDRAMTFTSEIYNDVKNNPRGFVNKWIVSEVEKMTIGLSSILNGDCLKINTSSGDKVLISDDAELIHFKAEKISGALSFIESIKTLSELNVNVTKYIKVILDCAREMYQQLCEYIENKNDEVDEIGNNIKHLYKVCRNFQAKSIDWNGAKNIEVKAQRLASLYKVSLYKAFKIVELHEIRNIHESQFQSDDNKLRSEQLEKGSDSYTRFVELSQEYSVLNHELETLCEYKSTIEEFFEKENLALAIAG